MTTVRATRSALLYLQSTLGSGAAHEPVPRYPRDTSPALGFRWIARAPSRPGGELPFGPAEVEAMSGILSHSTARRYGVRIVTQEWELRRPTVYAARQRRRDAKVPKKCGPQTRHTDAELTELTRGLSLRGGGPPQGVGLPTRAGIRTSKARVQGLMTEADLRGPLPPTACAGAAPPRRDDHPLAHRPDVG